MAWEVMKWTGERVGIKYGLNYLAYRYLPSPKAITALNAVGRLSTQKGIAAASASLLYHTYDTSIVKLGNRLSEIGNK
jgi:hypothetical protein